MQTFRCGRCHEGSSSIAISCLQPSSCYRSNSSNPVKVRCAHPTRLHWKLISRNAAWTSHFTGHHLFRDGREDVGGDVLRVDRVAQHDLRGAATGSKLLERTG